MNNLDLATVLRRMAQAMSAEAALLEAVPVPPVEAPVVPPALSHTLTIDPPGPGRRIKDSPAGIDFTATVTTTGIKRLSSVAVSGAAGNPWLGEVQTQDTTGVLTVTTRLPEDRSFVKYWDADDLDLNLDSTPIELVPAPSVPAAASTRFAQARQFMARQTIGLNQERLRPITMGLGQGHYSYLGELGITHCRFFPGYRWDVPMGWPASPGDALIDGFLDRVQACLNAGLQAYLDMTDVVGARELANNWTTATDYIRRFATRIAARQMDPAKIAVGAFNELAGGVNSDFNAMRLEADAIIHAALPKHLTVSGGAGWNSVQGWEAGGWAAPPHDQHIAQVHYYGAPGAYDWALGYAQFQALSRQYGGMPFVLAELGDDFEHMDFARDSGRWADLFRRAATGAGGMRPMLWAQSGEGHDFRLNRSATDAWLQPVIEASVRECAATIKANG